MSYTTTARRIQHNYRVAETCSNVEEARSLLASKLDDAIEPVPNVKPSIAFAYTGQGSHYNGLGKQLFETSSQFRADILNFNGIASSLGYPSYLPLLDGSVDVKSMSPLALQLGLCCIQMALTQLWASWDIKPDVVIGHSLGEYAALHAAGVVSASETIYLVGERAKILEELCTAGTHAMLACKESAEFVTEVIADLPDVEIACVNAPLETVVSGTVEAIDEAIDRLSEDGVKCTKLNTQFAFHSSQVDPILPAFRKAAKAVAFQTPKIPVVSPLMSVVIGEGNNAIDEVYLSRHAREVVNFSGGLAAAQEFGLINNQTLWVELGPHPVCLGFVKSEFGQSIVNAPTLRKDTRPYKTIAQSLATLHATGIDVNWNEYHRDFVDCVDVLDLPTYAFDNKNYWIQYTGDWNLNKGSGGELSVLPEAVTSSISTTTVQKVISEVIEAEADKATIVVESDVSRPDLYAAISGHLVNGTALCPSSLYADMALTVGDHLYKLLRPDTESIGIDVCHMEVFKPFIADLSAGSKQVIRMSAKADLSLGIADLKFFSGGLGKPEVDHAKCQVHFGSTSSWLAEWKRNAYLIKGRISSLKQAAESGQANKMRRGMAYKLFGALVDYDPKYRGMEEVILDSPQLEATAHVNFQTKETDGNFFCSPYWIDSSCHLAGFIVNANDELDSTKQVYISHGWESMRFAEPLSQTKTYRSYVKMQPAEGNMVSGDVYIFDGDRIIGVCGALKFQCIPRQLLNTFLPPKGLAAPARPIAAAKPKTAARGAPTQPTIDTAVTKTTTVQTVSSVTAKVLDIIAAEVGIPVTELSDAIEFAPMGVDSLMSLTISGRIREELEINVQSAAFNDHPTVGAMKGFLKQFESAPVVSTTSFQSTSVQRAPSPSPSTSSETSSSDNFTTTPSSSVESLIADDPLQTIIRETISSEMGVDIEELVRATDLADLGMDSLMGLSILGVLREKTGLELPTTFLLDNRTIKAIEKILVPEKVTAPPPPLAAAISHRASVTERTGRRLSIHSMNKLAGQILPVEAIIPRAPAQKAHPRSGATRGGESSSRLQAPPERVAKSVLLQGNPKTATKTFWLIPDGSGSPTSYMYMPEIARNTAVWGLSSPYMKTPEEYTCGVVGMATKFITEIKRKQPQGPYNIGGWSAGGVISFETVRQLIVAGDVVDVLAFIDTPCPLTIEPLPSSLHRFFGEIGLLGDGEGALERLPPWLLPHFAASVVALSTYDAKPIPAAQCPKVVAIWCEDGVCKYPSDRRPDPYPYGHAQWLLENRTDFGPNLWDEYIDKDKMVCRHLEGNHFSMMKDPFVSRLSDFLREALA